MSWTVHLARYGKNADGSEYSEPACGAGGNVMTECTDEPGDVTCKRCERCKAFKEARFDLDNAKDI